MVKEPLDNQTEVGGNSRRGRFLVRILLIIPFVGLAVALLSVILQASVLIRWVLVGVTALIVLKAVRDLRRSTESSNS